MFRYTPRTIPSQIFVIGCGGTGSRLVPLLTQFIASISKDKNPRGWLDSPTIFLIDDDVVESKNLLRQNFVAPDVGKHKATVLAQRYGKAYGVNVVPILKRVTGDYYDLIKDVPGDPNFGRAMVIMCVDTADARRAILNTVSSVVLSPSAGQGPFFIDAGNEDNFGQVRFFNYVVATNKDRSAEKLDLPRMSPCIIDIDAIPLDIRHYDEMVDMPGQGSCADLDQTLAINALMGAEIMGIVQNYYYVRPMTYNQVSLSLDGARSTTFNTPGWLQKLADHPPKNSFHNYFRMESAPYLLKFVKETEKTLAKIQAAAEKQAAKAAEPAETTPKRRRTRKTEEVTVAELQAESAAGVSETVAARATPPEAWPMPGVTEDSNIPF